MLIAGGALAFLTLAVPHPAGNDATAATVSGALALAIGVSNCRPDAGLRIAEGLRRRLRERSGAESAGAPSASASPERRRCRSTRSCC